MASGSDVALFMNDHPLGSYDPDFLKGLSPWFSARLQDLLGSGTATINIAPPGETISLEAAEELLDALHDTCSPQFNAEIVGAWAEVKLDKISCSLLAQVLELADFLLLHLWPQAVTEAVIAASFAPSTWRALVRGFKESAGVTQTVLGEAIVKTIVIELSQVDMRPEKDNYPITCLAIQNAPAKLTLNAQTRLRDDLTRAKWSVLEGWVTKGFPLEELELWQDECFHYLLSKFAAQMKWTEDHIRWRPVSEEGKKPNSWCEPTSPACAINLSLISDSVIQKIRSIANQQATHFVRLNPPQSQKFEGVNSVLLDQSAVWAKFPFLRRMRLNGFSAFHPKFSRLVFQAVVAGGAISSMFHGGGHGDIDFFIICKENPNYVQPPRLFRWLHSAAVRFGITDPDEFRQVWDVVKDKEESLYFIDPSWVRDRLPAWCQDLEAPLLEPDANIDEPLVAQGSCHKDAVLRSFISQLIQSIVQDINREAKYIVADCGACYSLMLRSSDGLDLDSNQSVVHIQFIKYLYSSIDALLVTLDIPASQCCFDGCSCYGTPQFLRCISTGDIIVGGPKKPSTASRRYPFRLVKYMTRGFGVLQPLAHSPVFSADHFLPLYERTQLKFQQSLQDCFKHQGVEAFEWPFESRTHYQGLALFLHLARRQSNMQRSDTSDAAVQHDENEIVYDSKGFRDATSELLERFEEFEPACGIEVLQDNANLDRVLIIGHWRQMLRNGRGWREDPRFGWTRVGFQYLNLMGLNYGIGPGDPQLDDEPFWKQWCCTEVCMREVVCKRHSGSLSAWRPLLMLRVSESDAEDHIRHISTTTCCVFFRLASRLSRLPRHNVIVAFYPATSLVVYAMIDAACMSSSEREWYQSEFSELVDMDSAFFEYREWQEW